MSDEPNGPLRVLFLCTENAARSQIAEALLHRKGGDRFVPASAGTRPLPAIPPETIAALAEVGIPWRGRPKTVDSVLQEPWDFVITLCDRAREECPNLPGRPVYAHWNTPDPLAVPPDQRSHAFSNVIRLLGFRLDLMLAIPQTTWQSKAAEQRLREVGVGAVPASAET